MSCEELQLEEIEVLKSIYDGDDRFKMLDNCSVQYKVGDDNSLKSFVIEFAWGPDYPNAMPTINLDAFYNNHIAKELKEHIVSQAENEAQQNIGFAMTYTLIEWAKDNIESLLEKQLEGSVAEDAAGALENLELKPEMQSACANRERKSQLSKAQKRKVLLNWTNGKEERPRGWDWVDIVKHLSQSGNAAGGSSQQ